MYHYIIIDDEELIRKGTIKKLQPLSHLITCCGEAEDGVSGIKLAEELKPDLIILDMQMPGMNGLELLPYLAEHHPDISLIVISGYQNFDYIKQAIAARAVDYILKPFSKEQIQGKVLEIIQSLENFRGMTNRLNLTQKEKEDAYENLDLQHLQNLILGNETELQEFRSQKLHYLNQPHSYILFTLYLKNLPPKHGLKEWLEENRYTALTISLMHPSIPQFQYLLLFLPHDNRAQADHLTQEFENIILLWGEQQGASFYCGISGLHSNISDMHTAASESIQALNSRKILCNAPLCDYQAASADPVRMEWPLEEVFLFRMENGELNAVSELTGQLFDFYCSIPDCTLLDVKRHLEHMSSRCSILLNVYLHIQNQETRAPHNVQAIVNKLFSFDDLKQYYLQYFMNITRMVGSQSVYSTSDLVDRIQIYMQRNFQNNLTEDFLASLFYLNRSYLSQIFRKRTGMKFVDYLNQLRIERAKELLTSTDLKMYQIAKRVGYDNPKYFFRIFKKKTGLTPEQYRKPATT